MALVWPIVVGTQVGRGSGPGLTSSSLGSFRRESNLFLLHCMSTEPPYILPEVRSSQTSSEKLLSRRGSCWGKNPA